MQFNQPLFKRLPILFGLMLSMAAQADDGAGNLEKRLKDLYPATRIERVQTSEIPVLYEVTMGKNSAYTDATGRYFIFGHLYDMKTQRDLTAERMGKLQRIDFSRLPLGDAIKTVRGKGERVLAVFSDPDCPYCKRLEAELDKLDNVTLYIFLSSGRFASRGRGQGRRCLVRAGSRARLGRSHENRQGASEPELREPDSTEHPVGTAAWYQWNADHAFRRRAHVARRCSR